jgi:hypothetical protein
MKRIHYFTAISTIGFATYILPLQGSFIAGFGGDYVTANTTSQASLVDIAGSPTGSDSIRQIGGFGTLINPVIDANYSGPAFRGGAQALKIGVNANNGLVTADVYQDAAGDYIRLFSQTPSGVSAGSSLNFVALWDVSTTFGDLEGISGRTAGGVSGSVISRFMIETSAGAYYVSDTSISGGFGGSTWSVADVSAESWALFTPGAADWRGDYGSLTFNASILDTTDIVGVGWFASAAVSSGTNATLTIRDFNVTAVPEPSTYALLGGLVALGFVMWRRRR